SVLENKVGVHRDIDIWRTVRIGAKELWGCDPDDCEWQTVDLNRLSQCVLRSTKSPLTQGETDDCRAHGARAIIILVDHPPDRRRNAKPAEIITGHVFCHCKFGLVPEHQVMVTGALISKDDREH